MDNFRYESLKPYPGKFEPLREDKTSKIRSQLEKLYRRENEKKLKLHSTKLLNGTRKQLLMVKKDLDGVIIK